MPKFSITLFVALLLASCQQTPAPPTAESSDAKNLELIQTYFKHFNAHDWQKMAAPDNSKFTLPICTVFTIENGLITQDFTYYDNF